MALVCLLFIVDGNSKQCLETNSMDVKGHGPWLFTCAVFILV